MSAFKKIITLVFVVLIQSLWSIGAVELQAQHTVAREWNEQLLEAIRNDFARPTVHARNLFHVSAAMYDAWALYDDTSDPYLVGNTVGEFTSEISGIPDMNDAEIARNEAISYAAYRLIQHRFRYSPGAEETLNRIDSLMTHWGFDTTYDDANYESGPPAALGNYIAKTYIEFGRQDGSKERFDYGNEFYLPVNDPLNPSEAGNPGLTHPNRWQPLSFDSFVDQSGNEFPNTTPEFLGAEWGHVQPFALGESDKTMHERDGHSYPVYLDPGPPPYIDPSNHQTTEQFLWSFTRVPVWASHHNTSDGVMIDISPGSAGNYGSFPEDREEYADYYRFVEDGIDGFGHDINPVTDLPYEPQVVPRGDYTRVISEYWADGPASETPPGHWFSILNRSADHPQMSKKWLGSGPVLPQLEWDVKIYFTLGAAMHDAAIAAWSVKGWYDYVRPISVLRWMTDQGQRSDPDDLSYDPQGIPLIENYIEIVSAGDPLAGDEDENIGKIKFYTWRGHEYIEDPEMETAGVGWMLAENWWPYQQPTFVTPPFAGYVSGHSTFSHAVAAVLEEFTGDPFFPGGMGRFLAQKNDFLEFEKGPSRDIELQWATYRDAAAESSLSRILGGIHPPADDIPGRKMGLEVGRRSILLAEEYFNGKVTTSGTVTETLDRPAQFELHQNYPNPFNPSTTFTYTLAVPARVELSVYDITGRRVSTVIHASKTAGTHTENWNASFLASGVYFYRLRAVGPDDRSLFTKTRRLTLLK